MGEWLKQQRAAKRATASESELEAAEQDDFDPIEFFIHEDLKEANQDKEQARGNLEEAARARGWRLPEVEPRTFASGG